MRHYRQWRMFLKVVDTLGGLAMAAAMIWFLYNVAPGLLALITQ